AGIQGTRFAAARRPSRGQARIGVVPIPGAEAEVATGRRNRIFPAQGPAEVIMQETQVEPFHFRGRLLARTPEAITRFLQANCKASQTFQQQRARLPVSGLWTGDDPGATLPYVLPLEDAYRNFLEISD